MPAPPTHASSARHRCAICNKAYSTNSHLRRHEATHSGKNASVCPVCSREFARVDLARKHLKKCSADAHDFAFPSKKRGKKRQACDRCSRSKLSCDACVPCVRCHSNGVACTYQRLDTRALAASPPNEADSDSRPELVDPAEPRSSRDYGRIPINFLLDFTDPVAYGTSTAVFTDTIDQNSQGEIGHSNSDLYSDINLTETDMFLGDSADWFTNFVDVFAPVSTEICSPNQYYPLPEPQSALALGCRMRELISQLSTTHHSMSQNDMAQENFNLRLAESVFTVHNLRHFVWVYFHRCHRHIPIIHRPTFDYEKATLPLVLALFLSGSQCAVPSDSAISAREFYDVAEEYIFSHSTFRGLLQNGDNATNHNDEIEVFQAALLIQILQNSRNDTKTRRWIRLKRHPCLVNAMRLSGLFGAKRRLLPGDISGSNWHDFISDELRTDLLVNEQYRIATWTYVMDSNFAVFFNNPPQVAISEMTGDFSCPEIVFEAETASEFGLLASSLPTGPQPYSPSYLVSLFFQESQLGLQAYLCERLTAIHLLVIICALQSITMTSKTSFLAQATAESIFSATDQWKELWDTATERDGREHLLQVGFARHAVEFCWLTRALAKIGKLGDPTSRYMQIEPTDSIKHLHEFIRKYKDIL
ncbi:hypothetical protein BP6252_05940 [Coleophoma cylindrospora]|uniref:C2H2-type domain-containing protein n=1 Tax=Coleophoma cylindrospora TaxID=1849047 RepID=A0A3D8RLF9_9HELO|nr:hypothetical protein BP6252_05940 [Coleophoma cylindrospora]